MACQGCDRPERKLCVTYGLPSPGQTDCWVTGEPLEGSC